MNARVVNTFHKTRLGHLVFGLVELALAYLFVSLAINTGSLWYYALTFIFLLGFMQNLVRMVWVHNK